MKKGAIFMIGACITASVAGGFVAWADQREVEIAQNYVQTAHISIDSSEIKAQAQQLGIMTEGKDILLIEQEIQTAELKQQAESLQIDTTGKGAGELSEAIYLVKLKEQAEALGIETAGKNISALSKEIFDIKLVQQAQDIDIASVD